MRKIYSLFIAALFLNSGCNSSNPAPAHTNTVIAGQNTILLAQNINNSYTISSNTYGSSTYGTTIATEETQTNNGLSFYILNITDDHSTLGCQFWFASKPSPGIYYVSNFRSSSLYGVSPGCVAIMALSPYTQYLSQSSTSITISGSGNNLVVTAANIPATSISNSVDIRTITTTATIP